MERPASSSQVPGRAGNVALAAGPTGRLGRRASRQAQHEKNPPGGEPGGFLRCAMDLYGSIQLSRGATRSYRPACASARNAANAARLTTCAPPSGRLLSLTAMTPGRLAAISTQPPLVVLRLALRQAARDRSVMITPVVRLGTLDRPSCRGARVTHHGRG